MRVSCWEMSLCALPGSFTWSKCARSFPSAPAQGLRAQLRGAVLESLLSWFWKAEQFFGVDQDTLNLKMLKIHSADSSPSSKASFQLVASTWFLSLGDDQEYFWSYSLNECCFLIFYLQCQECSHLLNPSELIQKLTSLLIIPCSSWSKTWNEMLHCVDDLSSCFPFPTEANKYVFPCFFALLSNFQFLVCSGILQSGVLAAAEEEHVLCCWDLFTDLLFCILHIGIQ